MSPDAAVPQSSNINIHELPRIEVPYFSGNFCDWLEFEDLFSEIVVKEKISESEKLRHLKTHVKGKAADILRSVQASQGNFRQAWKLLDDYYSNDKRLVAMFIESILDQPSLKSSSLSQLKKLTAGVNFSLNSLEQLGRATKQWDLLVTIIARNFDVESRREWDKKSFTLREIPTMKDLTDFINVRITILERFEASSSRKDVKQESSRSSRHSNHVSQVVNKVECRLCSMDTHNTHICQEFKSKSIDERYNIVKEKRLCFNCLGSHSRDRCPSKSRCRECNQKHHT